MITDNEQNQLINSNGKDQLEVGRLESITKTAAEMEEPRLKVYKRRWLVLAIVCLGISLRSFNQSIYGPINNILSEYFQVQPWQIDWLNSSHALVFVLLSFPMILVTTKLGFRLTVIAMTTLQTISFFLTTLSVAWRTTFPIAMVGQIFMAASTIISWSIPPTTAAIWFPTNEVATAVAIHVVARGTGEAIGCIVPNLVLKDHSTPGKISEALLRMFSALTTIAFCLTITAIFIVKDSPPLPPSEAQAKIKETTTKLDENALSTLKKFSSTLKKLFTNKVFVAIWFVFGTTNPIFRSNTVLFASIVRQKFFINNHINFETSVVLLISWVMYIVGSFISGPCITKTKAFKGVVVFSLTSLFLSCVLILIGLKIANLKLSFSAVILQGLFTGMSNTSLYELLAEVSYPIKPMSASMASMSLIGLSLLTYISTGRLILNAAGPSLSTAIPIIVTALGSIIILLTKPTYLRQQANKETTEETRLID